MLSPPDELKAPSPRFQRVLAVLWLICLGFSILAQVATTWRVYVNLQHVQRPFASLGLQLSGKGPNGNWVVRPRSDAALQAGIDVSYLYAIDGRPVDAGASDEEIARLVQGRDGGQVALRLDEEGAADVRLTRSPANRAQVYREIGRTFDVTSQFVDILLSAFILFVAFKLRRRKFREPVAILLSFALLFMAAVGTWPIWWWLGLEAAGALIDLVWLALLLVASPAFPSGRFAPAWTRWLTVAVPLGMAVLTIYTVLPGSAEMLRANIAIVNALLVLAALLCVTLRFRSTPAGAERQQMKWVTLGLGLGLILYAAGQLLEAYYSSLPIPASAQEILRILSYALVRISYIIIALGLLAPLLDYRLNDADAAIGRSAGYAAVTTLVGVVWTGTAASVDTLIRSYTANGDPGLAAGISTLIALAVFTPARTRALAWTEARFQRALVRLRSLPERIARWQHDDDPADMAGRALKAIANGVDATDAALVADPEGEQPRVIAVHNVEPEAVVARLRESRPRHRAADAFPLRIEMTNFAGVAIVLLVGGRNDGAFYSSAERKAIASVAEPLGDALRAVSLRAARKAAVSAMLSDIKGRLEKLESGR